MKSSKVISVLLVSLIYIRCSYGQSNDWQYYHDKGTENVSKSNCQEAIVNYSKSIELNNSGKYVFALAKTYHLRAHCKNELNDFRGAINDYNKIISLLESSEFKNQEIFSSAFYYRGICKFLISQSDEACKDWSRAGELGYSKAYKMISKNCIDFLKD